jgi:cardiolipin synthase A/B
MLNFDFHPYFFVAELAILGFGLFLATLLLGDVLKQRRAPASTAAWLLILLLLPYFGVFLYLLFGARKLARPRHRLGRLPAARYPEVDEAHAHPLDLLLRGLGVAGAVDGSQVQIHQSPEHALERLLALIRLANTRVLMDMYDLCGDAVGVQVFAALTERASAGIEVKILVDDIGSFALRSAAARALRAAGGQLVRFRPVTRLLALRVANLRNHRKIVVVDGRHAWTGGRNIAESYLSALTQSVAWQDFSFSVTGPAAHALENIAMSDWQFATSERLSPTQQAASPERLVRADANPDTANDLTGNARIQIVPSGPDVRDDTWYSALLAACFTAQRRLWLVSPYFVPDEALQNAIALAARRGVEVFIIVPKRSDNRIVDWVRTNYLRELGHCGAQVFFYAPRMLHAKLLLIDDTAAAAGTANLDARSLFLNYEVMTLFYSHTEIAAVGAYVRALLPECTQHVKRVGWLRETLSAPLRLLAPLL